jgi:hypothetical protein
MTPRRPVLRGMSVMLLGMVLTLMVLGAHTTSAFARQAAGTSSSRSPVGTAWSPRYLLPRMLRAPVTRAGLSTAASPPGHFPFQSARSADGLIVVHYYHEPTTFAQQLIALAQADLVHPIRDTLGFSLKRPVNIYVYATRSDFLAGAPVTDAAETEALTIPTTSSVYLVSSDPQDNGATDDLPHELTHVVFHQNEDVGHLEESFFRFFPNWLDEGLAAYDEPNSSTAAKDYNDALEQAVQARSLIDLLHDFTANYPSDPGTDLLAYAEARSLITYLVKTYGVDTLHRFLVGARNGDLNLDALTTYGADLRLLQSRWETSLGLQATVADQGFAPYVPPIQAFHPGTLHGLASSTQPFLIWSGDMIAPEWLAVLVLLTLWALLALWLDMRRTRRPQTLAPAADPLPLRPPEPAPGIAPPIEPYLSVLRAEAQPPVPAVAPAPVTSTLIVMGFAPRAHPHPRWFDVPLLALPLPLAIGAAALHIWLDPLHSWIAGYVSAALVGVAFLAAFIGFEIGGRLKRHVVRTRRVGLLIALLLVAGAGLSATPIGRAQAQAYAARGAYTLALRFYANAGESRQDALDDMSSVQVEWAGAAAAVDDFEAATAHLRAAIALDPSGNSASSARMQLVVTTKTWAQDLIGERHYAEAVQVYGDELGSPSCDSSCTASLKVGLDDLYTTWAGELALSGDYAAAAAKLQLVVAETTDPATAAVARQEMLEAQATQMLEGALAAGAGGDMRGMNAQLRDIVARYPKTAAAAEVSEIPQLVTGSVSDARGVSVAGDRLFFLAFATPGQARGFNFDFNHDTSVFKVATTIGSGGTFAARLQPGYWYVACWDDPTLAFNGYFNAPLAPGNEAFTVHPFTPLAIGDILGY